MLTTGSSLYAFSIAGQETFKKTHLVDKERDSTYNRTLWTCGFEWYWRILAFIFRRISFAWLFNSLICSFMISVSLRLSACNRAFSCTWFIQSSTTSSSRLAVWCPRSFVIWLSNRTYSSGEETLLKASVICCRSASSSTWVVSLDNNRSNAWHRSSINSFALLFGVTDLFRVEWRFVRSRPIQGTFSGAQLDRVFWSS